MKNFIELFKIYEYCINSESQILDAILRLNNKVSHLIVTDNQNQLIGTLSMGDIKRFLSRHSIENRVKSACNKNPLTCFENEEFSKIPGASNIKIYDIIILIYILYDNQNTYRRSL